MAASPQQRASAPADLAAPTPASRLPAVLLVLHVLAVLLAAASGYLARWSFHESTQSGTDGAGMELLVLLAVVGGLLSVACQVAGILIPSAARRRERLIAQALGVVLSVLPVTAVGAIGMLSMGSLLPQAGDLMSILTGLLLLAGAGVAAHLHLRRTQPGWAVLLCAGTTAFVVSFFSTWWVINGLALLLNVLGGEPGAAG